MIECVGDRWTHDSVRALINAGGGRAPEEIVREKARSLVARMRNLGWVGPPYDPVQLASLLGIRVRSAPSLFSDEAQLTPLPRRQLLLEFNPERAPVRRNYSICHEIAHTFFDDCYEIVHFRKSDPQNFGPDSEIETLCQIGAAELLMPIEDFRADMTTFPLSLTSVRELVSRYGASREAILRRMVATSNCACAVVFFSRRLKPTEKRDRRRAATATRKMRILYSVASPAFSVYLPIDKSTPDDSCVCRAKLIDNVVAANESWQLPGFGTRRIEAMALPVPDDADETTASVVAMLHATTVEPR